MGGKGPLKRRWLVQLWLEHRCWIDVDFIDVCFVRNDTFPDTLEIFKTSLQWGMNLGYHGSQALSEWSD